MRWRVFGCLFSLVILGLGLVFALVGLWLFSSFDVVFGDTVRNQMNIDQSVFWWYKKWLAPPVKETLVVHLFEVENAQELVSNPQKARAQLREVGPFVFRVERLKENIVSQPNDKRQIRYDEKTIYHFDSLLSYEDLSEKITIVNYELMLLNPFISSVVKRASNVARLSRSLTETIEQMLSIYQANIFVEKSIKDVVFGSKLDKDLWAEFERATPPTETTMTTEKPEEVSTLSPPDNNEEEMTMARQVDKNYDARMLSTITDRATIKILKLFDKAKPYLVDRLKVPINPYNLMPKIEQADGNHNNNNNNNTKSNLDQLDNVHLVNSISAFFKNNSIENFDVLTGVETHRNAEIIRWNQQSILKVWPGRQCNMLNGTDGKQFTPFLKDKTLYVFYPKICRSIPFELKGEDTIEGTEITFHRYEHSSSFLQSPFKNSDNTCFCRWSNNTKRCNYDGILDLSSCYSGAPVMLTNPHFSGRITRSIAKEVMGLSPSDIYTESFVDVEPVSGIVLNRVQKFQFNIHIRQTPLQIKNTTRTLREMIFPLFWYEEVQTTLPEYQNRIKYFFIYPTKYQQLAVFGIIGVGVVMIGFGGLLMLASCCSRGNKKGSKVGTPPGSPEERGEGNSRPKIEETMHVEPQDNYIDNQNYVNEADYDYDYEYQGQGQMPADYAAAGGGGGAGGRQQQYPLEPLKRGVPSLPMRQYPRAPGSRDVSPGNDINAFYRQYAENEAYLNGNYATNEPEVYGKVNGQPKNWNPQQDYYDSGNDSPSNETLQGNDGTTGGGGGGGYEMHAYMATRQANGRQGGGGGGAPLPPPPPPPETAGSGQYSGAASLTSSRSNLMQEIRQGAVLKKTASSTRINEIGHNDSGMGLGGHENGWSNQQHPKAQGNNSFVINIANSNQQGATSMSARYDRDHHHHHHHRDYQSNLYEIGNFLLSQPNVQLAYMYNLSGRHLNPSAQLNCMLELEMFKFYLFYHYQQQQQLQLQQQQLMMMLNKTCEFYNYQQQPLNDYVRVDSNILQTILYSANGNEIKITNNDDNNNNNNNNQPNLLQLAEEFRRMSKHEWNDRFSFQRPASIVNKEVLRGEQLRLLQNDIIDSEERGEEDKVEGHEDKDIKSLAEQLAEALEEEKRREGNRNNNNNSNHHHQSISIDEGGNRIRFYGPYRAYNGTSETRPKQQQQQQQQRAQTGLSWSTTFDEDSE